MVLTFKLADDVVSSLRNVLLSRGFVEYIPNHHAPNSWNFQWKTTRYSDQESIGPEETSSAAVGGNSGGRNADANGSGNQTNAGVGKGRIETRQKINHFQKTSGICRKDTLARNLRRMQKTWGANLYNFAPETFILPREAKEFEQQFEQAQNKEGQVVWICKPSSSSQGKNIFLITKLSELTYDCSFVVQRYIANPMLIGGYKYDLRIYVLVTSFRPLCVYMYREGLARFSSQKYDPSNMSNLFSHLTNASINKSSPDLLTDKDIIGSGCKWTIARWFDYLESIGVNPYLVWEKIKDIAILTLLPIVSEVPDNTRCFELFGFDIMLDDTYKPWIIEVNASPAIAISGRQDTKVKIPLLNDLLESIGFPFDASLAQLSNTFNFLPTNHPLFDPHAEQRAIDQAVASAEANAAAAAAATVASSDQTATSGGGGGGLVLNHAGHADKIQRVPRIVKMMQQQQQQQQTKVRDAANSKTNPSASSNGNDPSAASVRRRRSSAIPSVPLRPTPSSTLSSTVVTPNPNSSPIPTRLPSSSPSRSPNGSPKPSRITTKRATTTATITTTMTQEDGNTLTNATTNGTKANSTLQRTSSLQRTKSFQPSRTNPTSSTATTTSTSQQRSATSTRRTNPPSKASDGGSNPVSSSHSRPSAASSSASPPTAAPAPSPNSKSIGSAPQLIGDFERIFPFDAATTEASDSIATCSLVSSKSKSSSVVPLPVLFSTFAKSTIASLKSRIRQRERIVGERSKDASLPLRHAFTPLSLVPSPWTDEAIEAAVNRAKEAARAERARCGIPEPNTNVAQKEEEREMADEGKEIENEIQAQQQHHRIQQPPQPLPITPSSSNLETDESTPEPSSIESTSEPEISSADEAIQDSHQNEPTSAALAD